MTDVVVDTLRLRGAHGRRLARVASRALPAALERALADVDDLEIGSVRVVLDLDPEEYDDDTLAVLWADLIRAELVAHGQPARAGGATRADVGPGASTTGADMDLAAVARGWLTLPADARASVPAALLSLGDPEVALRLATELGVVDWERLVESLRRVLPVGRAPAGLPFAGTDPVPRGAEEAPGTTAPEQDRHEPGASIRPARVEGGDAVPPADVVAARAVAAAGDVRALVETLHELRSDTVVPLDPTLVTRAAGLVLLYPWLADHCHYAEELHPGLDVHDVREAALAALVDDATVADDPLVRMISGRAEPWDLTPRDRVELPHQDDVTESAERVLASFASLLPGFERSTPGFVRDAWLVRLGVLEPDRYPALLTAATHPLDVLLPLLPYPLGVFRLPWSPAMTVRFRP